MAVNSCLTEAIPACTGYFGQVHLLRFELTKIRFVRNTKDSHDLLALTVFLFELMRLQRLYAYVFFVLNVKNHIADAYFLSIP